MFNCSARLFSSATDFCFSSAISTAATPGMVAQPGTGRLGGCVRVHYRERSDDVSGDVCGDIWSAVSDVTRGPEACSGDDQGKDQGKCRGNNGECTAGRSAPAEPLEARTRRERRQGAP